MVDVGSELAEEVSLLIEVVCPSTIVVDVRHRVFRISMPFHDQIHCQAGRHGDRRTDWLDHPIHDCARGLEIPGTNVGMESLCAREADPIRRQRDESLAGWAERRR